MTLYCSNTYQRPKVLFNNHIETIYPALFRKVTINKQSERERITTPDDDFLDLDWYRNSNKRLVIVQHGLEGSSDRPYMLGMAKIYLEYDFDVCLWNYRGCSGEVNKAPIFYHSGATYDLETVVTHAEQAYDEIFLVGFSLGGNLTLKFLGEKSRSRKIKGAVAISVPIDLNSSSWQLIKPSCYIYEKRFLNNLKKKVINKSDHRIQELAVSKLHLVRNLRDFDNYFTAPIHGFDNAEDYYKKCSSKFFLEKIEVPTLILNAANDPLLQKMSLELPVEFDNTNVKLEILKYGGHVGFSEFNDDGYYWSEKRALNFSLQ